MVERNSRDIVDAAIAGEGGSVKDFANEVIMNKVSDALAVKRTEISRSWLNNTTGTEEE